MNARLSVVIEYTEGASMPSFGPNTPALGGRVIAFAVGDRLIDPGEVVDDLTKLCDGLSPRERQVAALIGLPAKEIGKRLGISSKTVNSYRYRIHDHLGVKGDVQAVKILIGATARTESSASSE